MSSVGPEFYDFIDRLKEANDRTSTELVESCGYVEPKLDFVFDTSSCSVCNGYYGPCFGEPVCMTCHNFLFPEFSSFLPTMTSNMKTDDGDSGNDEPSDLNFGTERHSNRKRSQINIKWLFPMNQDNEDATSSGGSGEGSGVLTNEASTPPPAVPQLPPLLHNLQMLSTPQPGDNLAAGLVEHLPPEVLLCIFSYLDDLTLCAAVDVCTRWRRLLEDRIPSSKWEDFTERRWPLYRPLFNRNEWCTMYKNLVNSTFCRTCVMQMSVQLQPTGEENSWRRNRLRSELKIMRNDPPEGIAAIPLDAKCFHWQASITGPVGSPYEGGIFFLYIQVPSSYPMSPPMVRFLTKVLHPNVSRHGDVGIDSVHHNWSLALTISKVLISIQSLLTDPYTTVCMEPEIGCMYRDNRPRFEELARRWTWRYAMCDALTFNYDPPSTSE